MAEQTLHERDLDAGLQQILINVGEEGDDYEEIYQLPFERTLENGSVREGLVGMVDLDAYDYTPGATSAIRATAFIGAT